MEGEIWCNFGYANPVPVSSAPKFHNCDVSQSWGEQTNEKPRPSWLAGGGVHSRRCARLGGSSAAQSGAARLTNSEENASAQSRRVGTFGRAELLEWVGCPSPWATHSGQRSQLGSPCWAVSLRRFEDKRWRNFRGPQSCSSWWSFTSAEDRTTETAPRRAETGPPVHARRVSYG